MKRFKAIFLMILLTGMLAVPARADVAFVPSRNGGSVLYEVLLAVAAIVVVILVIRSVRRHRQGK